MSGFPMALVVPGALTAAPDHPPAVSATPLSDTARGYAREASAPAMRRWLGAGWGRSGYPPDEVVAGQGTAAAKIRALAEAGYDRAEISKPLGIRYQHVRTTFPRVGVATGPRPMS